MVEEEIGAGRSSNDAIQAVATFVGMLAISVTVDDTQLREALAAACRECVFRQEEDFRAEEQEGYFWSPHAHGTGTSLH